MKNLIITSLVLIITMSNRGFSEFTIGVIPDTQFLSQNNSGAQKMMGMNQFFVDNKEELNLVWVASLGDMTQNHTLDNEWQRAWDMFDLLTQAEIPFSPCQGNHDNVNSINEWFPTSDFEDSPHWGGYHDGIENAYYLFTAGGMDFIILVFNEWKTREPADQNTVEWANDILSQHQDRRAFFVGHNMSPGEKKLTAITNLHDNVFMTVSGHRCIREEYWITESPGGYSQHNITSDYQCDGDGGATIRYYTFKPEQDQICAFTYNIPDQAYESDEDSEFCFDYDMEVETIGLESSQNPVGGRAAFPTLISGTLDLSAYLNIKASTVFDMTGKERIHQKSGNGSNIIDFRNLEEGHYIIRISTGKGIITRSIMNIQ